MKDSTAKASVVDGILEFNRDREPKLVRRKVRRMTKDPFAFFRGTDQLFATHWTRLAPPDVAPLGPHLRRLTPGELRRLPDRRGLLPLPCSPREPRHPRGHGHQQGQAKTHDRQALHGASPRPLRNSATTGYRASPNSTFITHHREETMTPR